MKRKLLKAKPVAKLHVQHLLRLYGAHLPLHVLLDVSPAGLSLANGGRYKPPAGAFFEGNAEPGVEKPPNSPVVEAVRRVGAIVQEVVIHTIKGVPDGPVLKVRVSRDPFGRAPFGTGEHACIGLYSGIVVPAIELVMEVYPGSFQALYPKDVSPVAAGIMRHVDARRCLEGAGGISQRRIEDKEIVTHHLAVNHVTFGGDLRNAREAVRREFPVHLVILVVAVSARIIDGGSPGKEREEGVGVIELKVRLDIVVRLVGVIVHVAIFVVVLPGAVVAAVFIVLLKVYSVPGDAAFLLPVKDGEPKGITLPKPSKHPENRSTLHLRVTDIAVRVALGEENVHVPPSGKKARGHPSLEHPGAE